MSPSTMSSAQESATKVPINRFNRFNYATWCCYMRGVFLTKSMWHIVIRKVTLTFANSCAMVEHVKKVTSHLT